MKLYFVNQYLLISMYMTLSITSESFYSINAPGVLKSNRKYSVVVTLHEANGLCSIRVGIEGPSFKDSKDVSLQPFQSQTIEFFPKQLSRGKYILKAEGIAGISFKNESELNEVTDEGPKIYIQTDKAIYKPQDLVQFRILILDEHTRPLHIKASIHVEILDAEQNRVKIFKNITLAHDVFTGKFKLSKYPVLGTWNIKVMIDGTYNYSKYKAIKILNYRLPKFSVYIKSPSDIILEDGYLKVAIYGKYTFNKYVEGNATIILWNDDKTSVLHMKTLDIQNLGFTDFNLKNIKDINKIESILLEAKLCDKYTGNTQLEGKHIYIRRQRYNLIVPYEKIEFENNKPYSINVVVKYWTGAPVLDHKTPVIMKHGDKVYESFLDDTGSATFEFEHDANAGHTFQFKDSNVEFPNIYTHQNLMLNNREFYCRLKLVDTNLKIGKPVLIEVSSIVNIPYLMYTVLGHASLVRQEYIKVPPNQKSYNIEINPSIEMVPESFIYVYYIHKGNLRYGEMKLKFRYEFENKISLSAPKQAKPGEEVTITINAQPKSNVGILAVDLGVYLLDNTYDLDKYQILDDLRLEMSYSPIPISTYPGILTGLVTLTNAHYPFKYLPAVPASKGIFPTLYRFRQKFPETWIFDNYVINETETKLILQIPDTITAWRITAFSNNQITGFGIVDKPTDITTIQPFFISLNLPTSVKRGEIVALPVTIFNYSNQTLDTEIILYNNDKDFYFMESAVQGVEKSSDEEEKKHVIQIAAEKGKTVKFLIYPKKVGEISLMVTAAASSLYSDAVLQKLKVEPDGVVKEQNQAMYLSIPAGEKISTTLSIEEPVDSVPDSQYVTFSVGGHYLVPTVENFQDLTQMPTGSGEQNMVNFAPGVLILQYLKFNNKLQKERKLVDSLLSALDVAYQQQLSFRHYNGGYSVFGMETDDEPSTWLTAYVVRYFIKATQFLDIESKVIESDLAYLASQQNANGEFHNTGYLLNPSHENAYGLTAFILLAFLEEQKYALKYRETIENGVEFLNSNLNDVSDINALCLMATVMKRAKRHNADLLINQLKLYGKQGNGLRWWSGNDQNLAKDIEITANIALTLLDTPGDHTSILKWLVEQRNANGGFISCHDTVVGLEALVKFSEKYKNLQNVKLKISYSVKDVQGNEVANDVFHVDSNNVLKLQKHELPKTARQITFEMEGNGASLVQLNQKYNVNNVHEFRHFNIETKTLLKNSKEFILEICFNYVSDINSSSGATSMVIIEVNLPSGYRSEAEKDFSLMQNDLVKRIETKNSETVIILYLDKLEANKNYCLEIPVEEVNEILMPKPAAIIMYDFYNLTRSNTQFYIL